MNYLAFGGIFMRWGLSQGAEVTKSLTRCSKAKKGFSMTYDRSQIISMICDRAQISHLRCDWT